ncbi:heme peroxidase [Roridomyces roridus]|uniref:Peroxidase n=1 Tax=Roridomyces roridus TaxID=1738132 RepID=A0AAD7BGK5_9AGAR|nr:heme peroxidase [Roridomyces roridus]
MDLFILLLLAPFATAYIWPSPQLDALESLRFDQLGFNGHFFFDFLDPCTFAADEVPAGRSIAADWIRTAYHDMATFNVTSGTGGMDASIRFADEQARPENVGDAFSNTVAQLGGTPDRYVSMADVLANAAISAMENCGGPEIPFRGGRLDAGEANAPGVPQPQDDLDATVASFARQGFTQTEMIGLVACGHTFGGVQHEFFPTIVPADANGSDVVSHFDTTFVTFDNKIATEYISGTTLNPLVVGFNDRTNSDKRIFGSDGNATMSSFAASPALYASTCSDLIARMVDTVPLGVNLTEVITPLAIKPTNLALTLDGDVLTFSGQVRIWNRTQSDATSGTVIMLLDDHEGGSTNVTLQFAGSGSATAGRYTTAWYTFGPIQLDAVKGLASLRFLVDGVLDDQNGAGYKVQDNVVFSASSCAVSTNPVAWRLDVGIRTSLNATHVFLETAVQDSVQRWSVLETDLSPPASPPITINPAYTAWSIVLDDIVDEFEAIDAVVESSDGERFSTETTGGTPAFGRLPMCVTQRCHLTRTGFSGHNHADGSPTSKKKKTLAIECLRRLEPDLKLS